MEKVKSISFGLNSFYLIACLVTVERWASGFIEKQKASATIIMLNQKREKNEK